jgi:hypothetical protein
LVCTRDPCAEFERGADCVVCWLKLNGGKAALRMSWKPDGVPKSDTIVEEEFASRRGQLFPSIKKASDPLFIGYISATAATLLHSNIHSILSSSYVTLICTRSNILSDRSNIVFAAKITFDDIQ